MLINFLYLFVIALSRTLCIKTTMSRLTSLLVEMDWSQRSLVASRMTLVREGMEISC
eukprot:m.279478 g.279478  ORF g.279478 m.279478 type:complete len:57 (+) comp40624_c0_seq22:957-1127(+)